MSMYILDLSKHQNGLQLSTLVGVDGFIFRAAIGTSKLDECVEDFIAQAKALGKPYGLYMADYAKDVQEAIEEADYICDFADIHGVDFPIYFDCEGFSNEYITNNFGISHTPELVQSMTTGFCDRVIARGYKTGVYFNKNYHDSYYTAQYFVNHPEYSKWLARPGVEEPDISCDLWQYASDNGSEFGYNDNVDKNLVINEALFTVGERVYQKFKFPMEYLRVTQGYGFNADGSVDTTSYSHAGSWAIDFGGKDSGADKLYLPCDMVVKRCRAEANGELYLESVEPVWFADGTKDYARMICLHDSEFNVAVGEILPQGTYFYDEGGMGSGDPNKFGTHVHIEVGKGKWVSTTQTANAQGTYVIENQAVPHELFIVGDDVVIMDDGGYKWLLESQFDAGMTIYSDDHLYTKSNVKYKVVTTRCEYFNSADVNDVAGKLPQNHILTAKAISKEMIGDYYWIKTDYNGSEYYVALVSSYLEEIPNIHVSGTITWNDVPEDIAKPSVVVSLYQNGSNISERIITGDSYAFENLPSLNENNEECVYTVDAVLDGQYVDRFTEDQNGNDFVYTYNYVEPEIPDEPVEPEEPTPEEPTVEPTNVIKVLDTEGLKYFYSKIKDNINAGVEHSQTQHAPVDAEKNTILAIQVNGQLIPITADRIVAIDVPTTVAQMTDANEYLKASDISAFTIEEIDEICK